LVEYHIIAKLIDPYRAGISKYQLDFQSDYQCNSTF